MSEPFAPRLAFAPFPALDGLAIREPEDLGLASVLARKGAADDLAQRLRERRGVDLPDGPVRTATAGLALIGTGHGTWLAVGPGHEGFAAGLARDLEGLAAVTDQSSGYAVLSLCGPKARTVLQKGAPIDLHSAALAGNAAAVTMIAHIGCVIWQERPDQFAVAVFRSMAGSFRHWLDATIGSTF